MGLPPLPVRPPSPPTTLPFRLRTLGRVRNQPYHVTAGTYHGDAMLSVVRAGLGHYHRDGEVRRVARGDLLLVLPGTDPGLLLADTDHPYDHYYCRFAGNEALRMARAVVSEHGARVFRIGSRWADVVSVLESMLVLERQSPSLEASFMSPTEGELSRLLSLLVTPEPAGGPRFSEAALRRYLVDHVAEPLSLEKMAAHFGVSRFHLSHRARALLGASLGRVSRDTKLGFALALLDAPTVDLGIAEIARRAGYDDPLYFSKVFRRTLGKSPREYRAERRKA
jgi:AraC-like DNA-binding protein